MNFKHKRLPYKIYTTGESNLWTYEYTWEDFETAIDISCPYSYTSRRDIYLRRKIIKYFNKHPKKLLNWPKAKDSELSIDDIKIIIKNNIKMYKLL